MISNESVTPLRLTPEIEKVMAQYDAFTAEAEALLEELFDKHFSFQQE